MFEHLTAPNNLPFAVAIALMLMLAVVQITGLGHLFGGDGDMDADMDLDAGLLSLIGLGRLPLMMWLMLLLTVFGLVGLAGQQFAEALAGGMLSPGLAAVIAGLVALPLTGVIARPLAAVIPRDETTAVSLDTLVGREGEVTIGVATPGSPARVRVRDVHGLDHYVMAEPDNPGQSFAQGERVLLVRREGDLFKAIARGDHLLPRLD